MRGQEMYMRRALDLAQLGMGYAAPNPMVGAVIVHEGCIIGEGYHHRAGEAHAEVMAIRSVKDQSLLSKSCMYVTLEPCSHYGKTPPCAALIIEKKIPQVCVAMLDPYVEVSGRGVGMLRAAGVEVELGLLEQEAKQLNVHFLTAHTKGRPFVTLKWAQTADGFVDRLRKDASLPPLQISSPLRRRWVHRLRMQHQAIMVGTRTALLDNPRLDCRYYYGLPPIRIVVDRDLSLASTLNLFDGSAPTWVLCEALPSASKRIASLEYIAIDFSRSLPEQVLLLLHKRKIQSLLVEGGSVLLQQFIDQGYYDSVELERSFLSIGSGVAAPILP